MSVLYSLKEFKKSRTSVCNRCNNSDQQEKNTHVIKVFLVFSIIHFDVLMVYLLNFCLVVTWKELTDQK